MMGAGHRDAEQKEKMQGKNISLYEEAQQTVQEELCTSCDGCSEDMRNEVDGCEGFKEDLEETLRCQGQFGAGA